MGSVNVGKTARWIQMLLQGGAAGSWGEEALLGWNSSEPQCEKGPAGSK